MRRSTLKGAEILISKQLLNDPAFDLGTYIRERLAGDSVDWNQVEVRPVRFQVLEDGERATLRD